MTGEAQVNGRNEVGWDEKFAYDIDYIHHITFVNDVKIILSTVGKVFKREGISSATSATMESFINYCISKGRKPRKI